MRLLHTILQRMSPAMYNLYLLWQLNAKAAENERARVACELHDGPIQSLIGIDMRLEVLRRKMAPKNRDLDQQLGLLQDKLRQEIADLREFMQRLKPVRVDSVHLVEFLADIAERFQRTTGITTRFVSQVETVELSEGVRCELVRILQEALINIRKHSGADTVDVLLEERAGYCVLVISDNGRGLDFTGRLSYAQLEARAKGPAVIKERLRLIGGELAIESLPDRGTRLEIMIPGAGNHTALQPLVGAEPSPDRK